MLINPDGLVFVGQRLDGAASGAAAAWQMPQGGIDEGEKPREAALRELREETGVTPDLVEVLGKTEDWLAYDLPPELVGKVWGGKYRGQKQKWFAMRYLGTDDQVQIVQPHQEFARWQWMKAGDMLEAIVPFKRAVYEIVVADFRAHLA